MVSLAFTHFVDGNDIRVPEVCGGHSLRLKPLHVRRAGKSASQDHLQRDSTIETALARPIDDPHAAAANFFEQFVVAKIDSDTARGVEGCLRR